jgi:hypothetical protein
MYGNAHTLVQDGQGLLRDAGTLSESLQVTLATLQDTMDAADRIAGKYYTPGRGPVKPFDISELETIADKINTVVVGLNQLVVSADAAERNRPWAPALADFSEMTHQRIDHIFGDLCMLVFVIFSSAVAYRIVVHYLRRRELPPQHH